MSTLHAGERIGHYEIVGPLGAGGMGEVYRGRDLKLHRDVAIKVLPSSFAADADRLARFEREARLLASLDHPHIAHIFGLEDGAVRAIAMEFVDGDDLSQYVEAAVEQSGSVPLDEALAIAWQIADALEAAHSQGFIHRDLKPANIKVRADGSIKVLDFGLAKAIEPADGSQPSAREPANSPTITTPAMTERGVILGTAAYMSPEQAKGRAVDKRADIWAFGVILFEMLTGRRLHQRDSLSETLASVLKEEADLAQIPARLRPLLSACLKKNPRERLHDIGDAKLLLEATDSVAVASAPNATVATAPRRPWIWWAATGILGVTAAALAFAYFGERVDPRQPIRLQIPVPKGLTFNIGTQAAISPDGRRLAFPAVGPDDIGHIYVRSLDSLQVTSLPGVEVAAIAPPPNWSFDGRSVIFGSSGRLMKAEVGGGPPQVLCDVPAMQGATSNANGVIIAGSATQALSLCPAEGGKASPVTTLATGENGQRWPSFLPDGRHFLYQRSGLGTKNGIYVGSLDTSPELQSVAPVLLSNLQAYYVPGNSESEGWLVFQRESTIMAQPFSAVTFSIHGEAVPIATDVGSVPTAGAGLFSVSPTGAMTYRTGATLVPMLQWFDPETKTRSDVTRAGSLVAGASSAGVSISPDGTRVAMRQTDSTGNFDIWVIDLERGTTTRLTSDVGRDDNPIWTPDGKRVIYSASRGKHVDLYERNADGSGEERLVWESDRDKLPTSVSPDGRYLLYQELDPQTGPDLWILSLAAGAKPVVFQRTAGLDMSGVFSPNGHWIAYMSIESGAGEVYIRPFDSSMPTSGKWMVSQQGGSFPRWRPDGRQLIYVRENGQLMGVDVDVTPSIRLGLPTALSTAGTLVPAPFGISPDGKRFLVIGADTSGTDSPFTVLLDWKDSLRAASQRK